MNSSFSKDKRIAILFIQLGSPKTPRILHVRRYLSDFLGDHRVVDYPPYLWYPILYFCILPFRTWTTSRLYRRIFKDGQFPLIKNTESLIFKMATFSKGEEYTIHGAYLLGEPSVHNIFESWIRLPEKIIICPLFPQYSESIYAAAFDRVFDQLKKESVIPKIELITKFHHSKAFIFHSRKKIIEYLDARVEHLFISFHGMPKRRILLKKDPYYDHCFETFVFLKRELPFLKEEQVSFCFQSRFSNEEWTAPYLEDEIDRLLDQNIKVIAIYCASFIIDCLETLDEVNYQLRRKVERRGGELIFIPCLNDDPLWVYDFYKFLQSNSSSTCLAVHKEELMEKPMQKFEIPPLSSQVKKTLMIIFLTLFLDLVGFSIIFPLLPAMVKYYVDVDGDHFLLNFFLEKIGDWNAVSSIVLFGGILGAIYSFLQFLTAPFWGVLSDRIGRKPILLISVLGLSFSYIIWFFSASFTFLIISRFIGGIMGGNISTATAVIADITNKKQRSMGMATIGMAFALGFIIGPALGGFLSMIDLTNLYPHLLEYGVNPFSLPAGVAALLSLFNLGFLFFKFKESLPKNKRELEKNQRSYNPCILFKPLPYRGINLTNFTHFIFLIIFSGMEFTLTFLAVERLQYTSMDNAYMFIFIGFIIILVQGGIVRRKAASWGEKNMIIAGLSILSLGLFVISIMNSSISLYLGLFFLAVGASFVIPCLTALISLYTPERSQGKSLGTFRSLGALARVIGPLSAAIAYWNFGSALPYVISGILLIIPIMMTLRLKKIPIIS